MAGKHRNDDNHAARGNYKRNVVSSAHIEKDVDALAVKRTASRKQEPDVADTRVDDIGEAYVAGSAGDMQVYAPTNTIYPSRPRTKAAAWDKESQSLFITFREGAVYRYDNVPERVWKRIQKTMSTGRMINAEINHFSYTRLH